MCVYVCVGGRKGEGEGGRGREREGEGGRRREREGEVKNMSKSGKRTEEETVESREGVVKKR